MMMVMTYSMVPVSALMWALFFIVYCRLFTVISHCFIRREESSLIDISSVFSPLRLKVCVMLEIKKASVSSMDVS